MIITYKPTGIIVFIDLFACEIKPGKMIMSAYI